MRWRDRGRVTAPPVVVIGAPRSGTNWLRDILTRPAGIETWNCDELPYMWRYRNASVEHDEFTADHARPDVRTYLNARFRRFALLRDAEVVVEKTCANSLRVDFVRAALPDARFVFITRSGHDAVPSAVQKLSDPINLRYSLEKAVHVPAREVGNLVLDTALSRRRVGWGPRYAGMNDDVGRLDPREVAQRQWAHCVLRATEQLATVPESEVARLRYDDLTATPGDVISDVFAKLGLAGADEAADYAESSVRRSRPVRDAEGQGARDVAQERPAAFDAAMRAAGY